MSTNLSKHAQIAKDGNKAEQVLCTQPSVKAAFEEYFGKPIQSISPIKGHKKSDYKILFTDGTSTLIQNKDGPGDGRGWSVNRMGHEAYGTDTTLHTLLANVCLKKGTDRPVVASERSEEIIRLCLLGKEKEFEPVYFTHTLSNKTTGEITSLSISPTELFLPKVIGQRYETMVPKKTCVHLTPAMYLQRKGGGSKDHAPDHIQAKFRWTPDFESVFTKLTLSQPLMPQTTSGSVEQTPSTQ